MDYASESLKKHYEWNGKLEVKTKMKIETKDDLSLAYTPGVATPCLEIQKDINKSYDLTIRKNLVAVISDGSAVLGLGNIGAAAAMPVMEGKCALFKSFADVDAIPLVIDTNDVDELVKIISSLQYSFGGINLEDISAPRCFEVERKLKEVCDIPVFHDDQHGTAIVVAAAMMNALKVVNKQIDQIKVVVNGAGSAGCAISKMLLDLGVKNLILVDKEGILNVNSTLTSGQKMIIDQSKCTLQGSLSDAMSEADVFIGVSAPNVVSKEMVARMNEKAIVFPMANPTPEIMPDDALEAGAMIVGSGRSDFKNQINNVLAFPGIFKGALEVRAKEINEEMKIAAAKAIASIISDEELRSDYIIPSPLNKQVALQVAKAVKQAAIKTKVARI